MIELNRPDWQQRAACRGLDPALFFPHRGEDYTIAQAICARCPVTDECLNYAIAIGERVGIWGGLTERQRRHARRQREERSA